MYSADQIAKYFLSRTDEEIGDVMTNLKLQKLLYYAQGFHLAIFHRPLFPETIEAWIHGPVVPDIYYGYSQHGALPIPFSDDFDPMLLDDETRELLDEVYEVFGQFSAWKLRNMTHEEAPWQSTAKREVISHEKLQTFFATRVRDN